MDVKDSNNNNQANLYQREMRCSNLSYNLSYFQSETWEYENYVRKLQEELKNENDQKKIQYLEEQIEDSIRWIKYMDDETRKAQIELENIYNMYPIN
jgi:hypothetical protein